MGAGGKTTAMYRLARELREDGWRVVTTSTTMIAPPAQDQSQQLIVAPEPDELLSRLEAALKEYGHVTVAAGRLTRGTGWLPRIEGLAPELIQQIRDMPAVDVIIVEADGCRGRPFKAPAAHEPIVPASTTILIPVVGVDAVGKTLSEQCVHRPELVASLTGLRQGQIITPETVAEVLAHPEGGLKGAPPGASCIPLINKVERRLSRDGEERLKTAKIIASFLLSCNTICRVIVAAVARDDPVQAVFEGGSQKVSKPSGELSTEERGKQEN